MTRSESKYFNTAARMDEALIRLLEKKEFEYVTIKEICEEAGVNRSTFYLHYENTRDLLLESMDYINEQFLSYFRSERAGIAAKLESCSPKELILLTPQYLTPYLTFIKEHKNIFLAALTKSAFANYCEETYQKIARHIFYPILDKWEIPAAERDYLLAFYMNGLIAVIAQWLKKDCSDTIGQLTDIMIRYALPWGCHGPEERKGERGIHEG